MHIKYIIAIYVCHLYTAAGRGGKPDDIIKPVFPTNAVVNPVDIPYYWESEMDQLITFALNKALYFKIAAPKDPIILVTGWKHGAGFANTVRLVHCPEMTNVTLASSHIPKLAFYVGAD